MSVRKIEVADATESLAAYVQETDAGPVVVLSEGRPVAALIALENMDLETAQHRPRIPGDHPEIQRPSDAGRWPVE